jgi:hypothetical protein
MGASTAASAALVELARSYLDLWHRVDPVEAGRFDREGPPPALRSADREGIRQQLAAARSLEGAVSELELESLDDEIDRTILLAAIRPLIRRSARDHPERANPTVWTGHLVAVLVARAGDAATLAAIPQWVETARAAVARPAVGYLRLALDDLAAARSRLTRAEWWQADKEQLSRAIAAVDRLEGFLRWEAMPDLDAGTFGERGVEWQLHHAGLIEVGATEAARRLRLEGEQLRGRLDALGVPSPSLEPPLDLEPAAAAYGRSLHHLASEIRRRVLPPPWLEAFTLFAAQAEAGAEGTIYLADRWRRIQLGRADLEAQLAGSAASPTRHPLEAAVAALLSLEWEALRARWLGDLESLLAAVLDQGLLHPILAGWRLGLR